MNNMSFDGRQITAIADSSENYLVGNDDDIAELKRLSMAAERKKQEETMRKQHEAALEEAKKKGEREVQEEKEFQAFWKVVQKEDLAQTSASGLKGLAENYGSDDDENS